MDAHPDLFILQSDKGDGTFAMNYVDYIQIDNNVVKDERNPKENSIRLLQKCNPKMNKTSVDSTPKLHKLIFLCVK